MKKSGWLILPVAFFLLINFLFSSVKLLFISRLIYFSFLILLFTILRRFSLNRILPPIVGGVSLILFLYGVLQKFVLFPYYLKTVTPQNNFYSQALITRIKGGRIFSLFALPTLYAIICTILILFILDYLITAKTKKSKIYWAALLLSGLFNLILTQSFGGILYLFVGVLIYLLLARILEFKYLVPVLMVLSLFLSITVALRFSEAKKFEPVKLRFSNWTQAVRMIESSPFWGVGFGNYESKISYYTQASEAKSLYAHNFFLQFVAETGFIITLILLLFLFYSRKMLIPSVFPNNYVYISIFLIILFYNLIDIGFYFFPVGISAVIALSQIYPFKKEQRKLQKDLGLIANVAILTILVSLMGIDSISENHRKTADFLEAQNDESAIQYYEKSLNFNPFNYNSMVKYAQLNFKLHNKDKAERYLNKALALYPDLAPANYLKSQIEIKKRHPLQAFYFASIAYNKNKLNSYYFQWYQLLHKGLEDIFKKTPSLPQQKNE